MSKCTSLFGHKFEARYDLSACKSVPEIIGEFANYTGPLSHILEKSRSRTYIHDVCIRWGEITGKR